MNQRSLLLLFFVVAVITFAYFVSTTPREATMLLINGNIHTLDPNRPHAEGVAIKGGRIVGTGSTEALLRRYAVDEVIDLGGRTVVPGFIDGHAHMIGLGRAMQSLNLVGISTPEAVAALVRERAKELLPGRWIFGRGWDQNLWPDKKFPTKEILDAAAPNNPVILGRIDGHAIWVNSRAMEVARIDQETVDPEGGRIIRNGASNPTGIFIDNATPLIERLIPPPSQEEIEEDLLAAAQLCVRYGLTEVHDMGVEAEEIAAYMHLAETGELPLRIYAAISVPSETWNQWQNKRPLVGYANDMLTIRTIKLYMDGAAGSRGAALVEDYSDDPGNRGLTRMAEGDFEHEVRLGLERGFQPSTHAIGDRANLIALNVYERVLKSIPKRDYRFRIEHVQFLTPADIPRFKQLGVLPSMQPTHATSDMYWVETRLGADRIKTAYAWRSLLETGSIIIGGSDFPVESPNPLWGFYAAITRSDHFGYPLEGWYGHQKMTREEALRAFTIWAAYGAFQEHTKGTIQPGKYADLTVLSKDIMTIPPHEILKTEVEMTIVGGRIVYKKEWEEIVP